MTLPRFQIPQFHSAPARACVIIASHFPPSPIRIVSSLNWGWTSRGLAEESGLGEVRWSGSSTFFCVSVPHQSLAAPSPGVEPD